MDKYEYNLKLDEIKKLVTGGNYEDAAKIADTVEWKRVRNTRTLCMISEIYEANGRLEDSKEILLRAYRRSQMTRTVLFRLTEVAIKMKEFDEAVEYYSEFVNSAPSDSTRYILKYEIYKGRGSSLEDQIAILEEYKEVEYTEQWGYELARLYYQAGDKNKCIECCDDLILWFRQGKYVIKALELKKSLAELTPVQQAIYDHRDENIMPIKERVEAAVPELEKIIVDKMPSNETDAITENIISETQKELAEAVTQHTAETVMKSQDQSWRYNTGGNTRMKSEDEEKESTEALEEKAQKDANVGFDTQQLQKELAESMRELLSSIGQTETEEEILEPKNDMSFFKHSEMNVPNQGNNNTSIDDILVSMSGAAEDVAATAEARKEPENKTGESPEAEKGFGISESPEAEKGSGISESPEVGKGSGVSEDLKSEKGLGMFREASGTERQTEVKKEETEGNRNHKVQGDNIGMIRRDRTGKGQYVSNGAAALEAQTAKIRAEAAQAADMNENLAAQAQNSMKGSGAVENRVQSGTQQGTRSAVSGVQQEAVPVPGVKTAPGRDGESVPYGEADKSGAPVSGNGKSVSNVRPGMNGTAVSGTQPGKNSVSGAVPNSQQNPYQQAAYQPRQSLTLNQQQMFSYFSAIQGLQEQIASALAEAINKIKKDKTSRSGNLVITGDPGSGRTTLGIRFAKAISADRGIQAARVAKIYAEDLNKKDIASTVAKIAGGTLIIEEAGDLSEEVVAQLSKAMEFRTDGLLVILEDEKNYLKELFDHYPSFAEKFSSEISIPIMTNDELVTFGKVYAYDEDYRIDDSATIALYNRISEMQTPEHPVCIADVRDVVDEAIQHSERAGLRKLGMILSHKRYDEEDRIILYEKDFK